MLEGPQAEWEIADFYVLFFKSFIYPAIIYHATHGLRCWRSSWSHRAYCLAVGYRRLKSKHTNDAYTQFQRNFSAMKKINRIFERGSNGEGVCVFWLGWLGGML